MPGHHRQGPLLQRGRRPSLIHAAQRSRQAVPRRLVRHVRAVSAGAGRRGPGHRRDERPHRRRRIRAHPARRHPGRQRRCQIRCQFRAFRDPFWTRHQLPAASPGRRGLCIGASFHRQAHPRGRSPAHRPRHPRRGSRRGAAHRDGARPRDRRLRSDGRPADEGLDSPRAAMGDPRSRARRSWPPGGEPRHRGCRRRA